MFRRRVAMALITILALVAVGAVTVRHLERNHVEHFDGVAVAVEGRDLDFWPFDAEVEVGVGTMGKLGLVKGRCLGFVRDPEWAARSSELTGKPVPPDDGSGTVIVWPAGVRISGSGNDLEVRSQGRTVRVGDRVQGGNTFGHDLSGIKEQLPSECRNSKLVRVGLDE